MLFCTGCESKISPRELHDFSSNRKSVRPECPICMTVGKLHRDDGGGLMIHAT